MENNIHKKEFEILTEEFESLSEYIQDLWQFLPLPIFNINPQGIILDTNQAFAGLSAWSLAETIGKHLNNFFSSKETKEIISQTLEKKYIINKEAFLYDRNKEKIPVAIFARAREGKEKNISGIFIALLDIRENKKFQEKLEELVNEKTKKLIDKTKELEASEKALINILEDIEETRYNLEEEKNKTLSIITNFTDGLLFFDKDKRLALANPQSEIFFALSKESIINKTINELINVPNIGQAVSLIDTEVTGITKNEINIRDGLVLESIIIPVLQNKKKIGTMVILHDITREKLVEKMKTEFVSLAAHQLRTPLSAIKWTMKMLLDGDLGKITAEQKTFVQKTYQSNERMIRLINDLLNVARIEEGRFLFEPTLIQISDTVSLVIKNLREKTKRKNIEISFKQPKKILPLVKADSEKVEIAITNIIDNAIDYTPLNGKINISLSSAREKTKPPAASNAISSYEVIKLAVQDSGVGIPKSQQKRIFSKFFRGENVIKMETEGTGLGMFITKNIIEKHGGEIWFESEEGKGTTFYLTFPIKDEVPALPAT